MEKQNTLKFCRTSGKWEDPWNVAGKRKFVTDPGAQGAGTEAWQQFAMAGDYESCFWNLEGRELPVLLFFYLALP